ncbi:MAG: acyltransferase family protein, partial [Planctomycetota bacterium]
MSTPVPEKTHATPNPEGPNAVAECTRGIGRRHDLDALRAIAMLLGIVLHAALSFAPIPWAVSDSRQHPFFEVLFAFIHGFRMPLFFLISGFFTAMLWRQRGVVALIQHRAKRIALPLLIGCFSIVPAMWAVTIYVSRPSEGGAASEGDVSAAVIAGDSQTLERLLRNPQVDLNELQPSSGASALSTAVFLGRTEMVEQLVQAGADVNQRNRDNAMPLHVAAFMGRAEAATILIHAKADTAALDGTGRSVPEILQTDVATTRFVAGQFGLQIDEETLRAGRGEIARQLGEGGFEGSKIAESAGLEGLMLMLFHVPVFMHLWFLWFL